MAGYMEEKTQNRIPCSVNIQLYTRNLFNYFTIKCWMLHLYWKCFFLFLNMDAGMYQWNELLWIYQRTLPKRTMKISASAWVNICWKNLKLSPWGILKLSGMLNQKIKKTVDEMSYLNHKVTLLKAMEKNIIVFNIQGDPGVCVREIIEILTQLL